MHFATIILLFVLGLQQVLAKPQLNIVIIEKPSQLIDELLSPSEKALTDINLGEFNETLESVELITRGVHKKTSRKIFIGRILQKLKDLLNLLNPFDIEVVDVIDVENGNEVVPTKPDEVTPQSSTTQNNTDMSSEMEDTTTVQTTKEDVVETTHTVVMTSKDIEHTTADQNETVTVSQTKVVAEEANSERPLNSHVKVANTDRVINSSKENLDSNSKVTIKRSPRATSSLGSTGRVLAGVVPTEILGSSSDLLGEVVNTATGLARSATSGLLTGVGKGGVLPTELTSRLTGGLAGGLTSGLTSGLTGGLLR